MNEWPVLQNAKGFTNGGNVSENGDSTSGAFNVNFLRFCPRSCLFGHDNIADTNQLWSYAILTTGHGRDDNIAAFSAVFGINEFPDRSAN